MNAKPLYQHIASALNALSNCIASKDSEWQARHEANLETLAKEFLPSGSGIDCGTKIDIDASLRQPGRIVLTLGYHHMNDGGHYDGWTTHKVIVSPSLSSGFDLKLGGRDRNDIKDYLADVLNAALSEEIEHNADGYVSPARVASVAQYRADVTAGKIN